MATLPLTGQLDMATVNTEFGHGLDLNSYRGKTWWMDDASTGKFSVDQFSMDEFHGKRATAVGIQSFYGIGATERGDVLAGANLGPEDPHRYIIVCGYWATMGTTNVPATGAMACTVGGATLPTLWYKKDTVQKETIWRGIYGGYVPNGVTADIRLTPTSRTSKMVCAYGLTGSNVQLLRAEPGDLGKFGPVDMPALSVIVAVANNMGVNNMTPTNITKYWEDSRTGEATGSFYNFANTAQTGLTVDTGGQGGHCAFVLVGSPAT